MGGERSNTLSEVGNYKLYKLEVLIWKDGELWLWGYFFFLFKGKDSQTRI